jgi:O-Antigen ligase
VFAAGLGYVVAHKPAYAVALGIFAFGVAVTTGNFARLGVIAIASVWLTQRAPGLNVSFSDILVAGAAVAAWVAGAGQHLQRPGRFLFRCLAFYLATLSVTLVYNHSFRSDFEWFHRIALVAGAILVGAWMVRAGLQHRALQALLATTTVVAADAVVKAATSGFAPVYPFGIQKNFVGSLTATLLLVVIAAPGAFRLPTPWLRAAGVVAAGGLAATQSRGAMLAFITGALIWYFRTHRDRRRRQWKFALVFAIAFAVLAGALLRSQLQQNNPHGSVAQRFQISRETRKLWHDHPWTGVGLRFFARPQYASTYSPPNNVVDEALAESGIPGMIGFAVFLIGAIVAVSRARGELALAGLAVTCGRFVHGFVDIYWVAGTTALAWIIAGMGLAVPRVREELPPLGGRRVRRRRPARRAHA